MRSRSRPSWRAGSPGWASPRPWTRCSRLGPGTSMTSRTFSKRTGWRASAPGSPSPAEPREEPLRDPLDDAPPVETRKAVTGIAVIVLGIALLVLSRPSSWFTISLILGLVLTIMLHEAGHLIMAKRA